MADKIIEKDVKGTIKYFHTGKGFGFIERVDGGKEVFVHISEAERAGIELEEGQMLLFDIEEDKRNGKQMAINLRRD